MHEKGNKHERKERITIFIKKHKARIGTCLAFLLAVFLLAGAALSTSAKISAQDGKQPAQMENAGVSDNPAKTQTDLQNAGGDGEADKNKSADESEKAGENGSTDKNGEADGNIGADEIQEADGQQDAESDTADEQEEQDLYFERDGKWYELVPDLITGKYIWASVLTEGNITKDEHGCEHIDHYSQERSFERVGGKESMQSIPVRRWDNLRYSAGEYLIFEYNGTMHVSKNTDLYHPVLSYETRGTCGNVTKVPQGYMTADTFLRDIRTYEIHFYDEKFAEIKTIKGYRAMENGHYYEDGRMAVRDMQSGLMGFLDEEGAFAVPCQYAAVSDFSNGYASVLTGAELVPYTEDGGTVQMYCGKGGQWGIIDIDGNFVLEPSKRYANDCPEDSENLYIGGFRSFGPVREDGTVDFLAADEEWRVLETVNLKK